MKKYLVFSLLLTTWQMANAQSFEIMPGSERVFIDAQYLNFFDADNRLSLFSRARATAAYDEPATDLFTGAYLNYTTKVGFGGTLLGRVSSSNAGIDAGVHYFRVTKSFMIYALPSININEELLYSWFSILRYTLLLKNDWKLYSSIELFAAFDKVGYLSNVQRIRLGLDKKGYQFGGAININQSRFTDTDVNFGVFLRKNFGRG